MFFTPTTLRRVLRLFNRGDALRAALVLLALCACASAARAADPWQAKLDAAVRFYQTTDVGVLVVGTEKSLYGLDSETGDELWKREVESEVEMMPAITGGRETDEVPYTLDNYRPPAFLDGRLYLFYEGITSLDARTGKERRREKFRVNEEGLALTEADPVADERLIYLSGRGHVRAVSRADGEQAWESKDLGLTPEMILTRGVLYARTGGQFTRLGSGEPAARGPYGVSAVDTANGKTLWRFKGADKRITNIALVDQATLADLTSLAANYGRDYAQSYARAQLSTFGVLARAREFNNARNSPRALSLPRTNSADVEERLLDRLDPAHQLERLSRFLLRTRRLAAVRGQWMYFYTDLRNGHGLAGVNLNTGATDRAIRLGDPDERFISDETAGLLYTAKDNRLLAFSLNGRE